MELGLRPLQSGLHFLLLQVRNLHRIIHSFEFESAYAKADDDQRKQVKVFIDSQNQKAIQQWITAVNMANVDLACLPVTELRKIGRKKGVDGYQYLPKASLLSAIKQREQHATPATV